MIFKFLIMFLYWFHVAFLYLQYHIIVFSWYFVTRFLFNLVLFPNPGGWADHCCGGAPASLNCSRNKEFKLCLTSNSFEGKQKQLTANYLLFFFNYFYVWHHFPNVWPAVVLLPYGLGLVANYLLCLAHTILRSFPVFVFIPFFLRKKRGLL